MIVKQRVKHGAQSRQPASNLQCLQTGIVGKNGNNERTAVFVLVEGPGHIPRTLFALF